MEEREQKRGGAGIAIGCAVLFFIPPLYVLSLGPAAWLALHFPATEDFLQAVYFPLEVAAELAPPLERALHSYVDFWE